MREPRFQQRKQQLRADCQVPSTAFRGAVHRLEIFAQPFVASLPSPESQQHTRTYLSGLLSDLEHKNAEAIAYRYDLDRQTLQHYLGTAPWDHLPPMDVWKQCGNHYKARNQLPPLKIGQYSPLIQ